MRKHQIIGLQLRLVSIAMYNISQKLLPPLKFRLEHLHLQVLPVYLQTSYHSPIFSHWVPNKDLVKKMRNHFVF